jgi:hypothetical protein
MNKIFFAALVTMIAPFAVTPAKADCGDRCQMKCQYWSSQGVVPSYTDCVKKWSVLNGPTPWDRKTEPVSKK